MPAKYALVIMIRGISLNWKQPVAYFLISSCCDAADQHNIIIFSTITKFQNILLNVKAFITDQGSSFKSFSRTVYVGSSRQYFTVN